MTCQMKWIGSHVEVTPPHHPKKITATRFASILGLNPWSSPFEIWCAITRTYEKPFEDTIYTKAGKIIEPKQIAYMRRAYAMDNLRTPTDVYGADYFKKTYGDFFADVKALGGMWDSLLVDENGRPDTVLEFKTTKRSEDWAEDVPEYYALQAALYAYLLGVDDVIMIASFLNPRDYENPDAYVPSARNTITHEFKVSQRYPDFDKKVESALNWWDAHVLTGISPDFDEKRDAEILAALRTTEVPSEDIDALLKEAEQIKDRLDVAHEALAKDEKRYKAITEAIRNRLIENFREGDTKAVMTGGAYSWEVQRIDSLKIDEKALEQDGLLDKYKTKVSTSYRLSAKSISQKSN